MQKTSQKEFRMEKVNEKETSYMSNEKGMIIHLIIGLWSNIKWVNTFLDH